MCYYPLYYFHKFDSALSPKHRHHAYLIISNQHAPIASYRQIQVTRDIAHLFFPGPWARQAGRIPPPSSNGAALYLEPLQRLTELSGAGNLVAVHLLNHLFYGGKSVVHLPLALDGTALPVVLFQQILRLDPLCVLRVLLPCTP